MKTKKSGNSFFFAKDEKKGQVQENKLKSGTKACGCGCQIAKTNQK